MEFPHTLIIILIMIVFAAILTYLVQAGQYDRIEVAGRKVVDPSSYHTVPANRATPFDIFVAIPAGMQAVAGIANMVLIIGGSFAVIEATGATKAVLAKVLKMGGHLGAAHCYCGILPAAGFYRQRGEHAGICTPGHSLCPDPGL